MSHIIDESERLLYLEMAKSLVCCLEAEQQDEAERIIDEMTSLRETEIFMALGRLARALHTTISDISFDSQFEKVTSQDIPDAINRLNYVVELLNEAAHKTLNHVDACLDICGLMTADQSVCDTDKTSLDHHVKTLREGLNEIVLAQSFQDLSGQVLHRVIEVVGVIEGYLILIIRHVQGVTDQDSDGSGDKVSQLSQHPSGPQIPNLEDAGVMKDQDEVDDLLSSMGF